MAVGTDYALMAASYDINPWYRIQAYQCFLKHLFLINQARTTLHLSKKTLACTPHITNRALREMARDYLSRYLHSPNEMMSAR